MGAEPTSKELRDHISITILFLVLSILLAFLLLGPTLAYGFYWIRSWTYFCIYSLIMMSLLGGVLLSLFKGIRLLRRRQMSAVVILVLASTWLLAFGYVYIGAILHVA